VPSTRQARTTDRPAAAGLTFTEVIGSADGELDADKQACIMWQGIGNLEKTAVAQARSNI